MSKELKNLSILQDMLIGNGVNDNINDYVDNLILPIKQALQRLEAIDNANPSEAMEYVENIQNEIEWACEFNGGKLEEYDSEHFDVIKQALLKAQKEHKALEIIKEKTVDVCELKICIDEYDDSLYQYNKRMNIKRFKLTEEEFDLLKEVLGC